jgi:starch phosphorylase
MSSDEVVERQRQGYRPRDFYERDPELRDAIDAVASGTFSPNDQGLFAPVVGSLLDSDPFMVLADYAAYAASQREVENLWRAPERWTRASILNVARSGRFSSDRAVREYCDRIWKVTAVNVSPNVAIR